MGSMRSDQTPNGVFREVGVGSAEEYGDVVGIGRQVGKRGILLALTPRDGGFRVFFNRAIMAGQQAEEFLRRWFTVKRRNRARNLFRIGHDFLLGGIPRCRIVRRVVQHDIPDPKDVPDPEIAKGLLRLGNLCGLSGRGGPEIEGNACRRQP